MEIVVSPGVHPDDNGVRAPDDAAPTRHDVLCAGPFAGSSIFHLPARAIKKKLAPPVSHGAGKNDFPEGSKILVGLV